MKTMICFLAVLLFLNGRVYCQEKQTSPDSVSFYEMSLEQLMNIEISVASRKALTPRESPGIVTLITEDEITNSGAQDLMDILRLVPGFDFGSDVEGVVGLGIRGNWAHEGKMLLLIDGQQMNEALYSTIQLGNHYPVQQIRKIEIIRGPGSAMYGGNAEYAVINIITKNDKEFTGVSVSADYANMKHALSRRNVSLNAGKHFGDLALNIGAVIGEGNRADGSYTDYTGRQIDMNGAQQLNPSFFEAAISYKSLDIRAIGDIYSTTTMDGYDASLSKPYPNDFSSWLFEVKYNYKISEKLSIVPRFNFKEQTPWNFKGGSTDDEFAAYNRSCTQPMYNITCSYDPNSHLNLLAGGEYFRDKAVEHDDEGYFNNGTKSVYYSNTSFFTQALWINRIANVTVGARFHHNDHFASSFVPRIGITKVIDHFHAKLLFSKAYRAPGIENIDCTPSIKPESTTVTEFETGYQFNNLVYISANLYDIITRNPILYFYDEMDGYRNDVKSGTRGVEMDVKLKGKICYAGINYSYYINRGNESIADYSVPHHSELSLAFPAHKVNVSCNVNLSKHVVLNGSLTWNSERYAFIDINAETGENITKEYEPCTIASLYISFPGILVKGLTAGIGCHNILDEEELYIQPYNSYHSPLPGPSREFRFRLSYDLKFLN